MLNQKVEIVVDFNPKVAKTCGY